MNKESWGAFEERCRACHACDLAANRKNVVISRGAKRADLILVGEGPGAEEDAQGLPFVGASGKLLTYLLAAHGFGEKDYHICNIVKCRPPNNRKPLPGEALSCSGLLREQLELVRPRVALLLGATAFRYFTSNESPITQARGKFYEQDGLLVLPTFHPAYILRNNNKRIDLWSDIALLRHKMEELGLLEKLRFVAEMPSGRG